MLRGRNCEGAEGKGRRLERKRVGKCSEWRGIMREQKDEEGWKGGGDWKGRKGHRGEVREREGRCRGKRERGRRRSGFKIPVAG